MADPRLFVACDVPEEARAWALRAVQREAFEDARWVPIENQHLTLKFLGGTPEEKVIGVIESCSAVASSNSPRSVGLGELGVFPSLRRVSVLWVGVSDEGGILKDLASGLDDELSRRGWEPEKRPYVPHLTLARFKPPQRLRDLPMLPDDRPTFEIDAIVLYRSHLGPTGSRYEVVERFPLASSG